MANYHNNHQNSYNSHGNYSFHNNHGFHNNHHGNHNNRSHHRDSNRDGQAISSFVLGTKELENKNTQFQYDKGWYSIIDIIGEEKNLIYKSKNAQEAYTKWNVYIGRKKERSQKAEKTD